MKVKTLERVRCRGPLEFTASAPTGCRGADGAGIWRDSNVCAFDRWDTNERFKVKSLGQFYWMKFAGLRSENLGELSALNRGRDLERTRAHPSLGVVTLSACCDLGSS